MLRKLLKYDLRSMWKRFSIIWPAALALGLLNRFILFRPMNGGEWMPVENGALGGITMTLFIGVLFAMFVLSMVYVIQRFYKGLLGDEGYLMHTLPVKTWKLVASKLICAVLVTVINVIVAGLAMFLMMPLKWSDLFVPGLWDMLMTGFVQHPEIPLYLLEFCLVMLAALTFAVTQLYLAMAIGHLFSRRRVLMSVAAYFGLSVLISLALNLMGELGLVDNLDWFLSAQNLTLWGVILFKAVPAAIFFAATSYILKNRLNLE